MKGFERLYAEGGTSHPRKEQNHFLASAFTLNFLLHTVRTHMVYIINIDTKFLPYPWKRIKIIYAFVFKWSSCTETLQMRGRSVVQGAVWSQIP